MSKRNYSQYSKKNDEVIVEPVVETETEMEITTTPATVEPTPEVDTAVVTEKVEKKSKKSKPQPVNVTGTVVNCAKLNVRVKADVASNVVCILDAASEIEINVAKSTKDWVSVCTATGIEGYCMRKFINADL